MYNGTRTLEASVDRRLGKKVLIKYSSLHGKKVIEWSEGTSRLGKINLEQIPIPFT